MDDRGRNVATVVFIGISLAIYLLSAAAPRAAPGVRRRLQRTDPADRPDDLQPGSASPGPTCMGGHRYSRPLLAAQRHLPAHLVHGHQLGRHHLRVPRLIGSALGGPGTWIASTSDLGESVRRLDDGRRRRDARHRQLAPTSPAASTPASR